MNRLYTAVTSIDMFSQGVSFRTSKDSETQKSLIGTLFTLVIIFMTGPYLVERSLALMDRSEQVIRISTTNDAQKAATESLSLTVGNSSNVYGYSFRLVASILDLSTNALPEDFDRIGSVSM